MCLEGADETIFRKAEEHLCETGGIDVDRRQIQRVVQRIGKVALDWQNRDLVGTECVRSDAKVLYVSADGTGNPMRKEELQGEKASSRMEAPRPSKFIWVAFLLNTRLTKLDIPSGILSPPATCRAMSPS